MNVLPFLLVLLLTDPKTDGPPVQIQEPSLSACVSDAHKVLLVNHADVAHLYGLPYAALCIDLSTMKFVGIDLPG